MLILFGRSQGTNIATEVGERIEIDNVEFKHSTVNLSLTTEGLDRDTYVDEVEEDSDSMESDHDAQL